MYDIYGCTTYTDVRHMHDTNCGEITHHEESRQIRIINKGDLLRVFVFRIYNGGVFEGHDEGHRCSDITPPCLRHI